MRVEGLREARAALRKLIDSMERIPTRDNPLLQWERGYAERGVKATRPTVAQSGTYRGNRWPKLEPAYTRKDGTAVPVWGGVKRVRSGRVTRAGSASIRRRDAGPGIVRVGQTFGGGTVLGKLKSDGTRYTRSDKQLGKIRAQGLLGDWFTSKPRVSANGKRLVVSTNKPYARRVAERRPFHWGRAIERVERRQLERAGLRWMERQLREFR